MATRGLALTAAAVAVLSGWSVPAHAAGEIGAVALSWDAGQVKVTWTETAPIANTVKLSTGQELGTTTADGANELLVDRALMTRQAMLRRIDLDGAALDYLVNDLHRRTRRPLLAAYPHELLGRIADFAGFAGRAPRCDIDSVVQAWSSLFGAGSLPAPTGDLR